MTGSSPRGHIGFQNLNAEVNVFKVFSVLKKRSAILILITRKDYKILSHVLFDLSTRRNTQLKDNYDGFLICLSGTTNGYNSKLGNDYI